MKIIMFKIGWLFLFLNFFNQVVADNAWNWQNPLPHGNEINDVYVFNYNKIITVGGAGTIMYTIDGGLNWTVNENVSTSRYGLNDVFLLMIL